MTKCLHYYSEKFRHGKFDTRYFECINCREVRPLSRSDKEFFFGEKEITEAWGVIFKALIAAEAA